MPEVLFAIAADSTWAYLNPAWARLTGFTMQESIGRSYLDFVWHEDKDASGGRLARLLTGDATNYRHDVRIRRQDGGFRWVTVHASVDRDAEGRVTGTCGSMVDITNRKLIEALAKGEQSILEAIVGGAPLEALRRSEQRFRDFTEVASDWLWETDANFRTTYVSGRVQDTLSIAPADMLGRWLPEALGQDTASPKWRRHMDDLRARRRIKDFQFSYHRPGWQPAAFPGQWDAGAGR